MKNENSVGPLMKDNRDAMYDNPCVASMLCKYFVSAFSAEYTNDLLLIDTSTCCDINVLSDTELSLCAIYKKLKFQNHENLLV